MVRFIVIMGIFAGLQVYTGWHLKWYLDALSDGGVNEGLFWPLFGVIAFSYLLSRLLGRWLPHAVKIALKWIGSYYLAVFQYAALLLPLADIAGVLIRAGGASNHVAVLSCGTASVAGIFLILLRGSWNAWSPIVREYEVVINKAAGERRELHVVFASDLHLGTTVRGRHLDRLVRKANELRPDLMLLPGDVLDDAVEPFLNNRYGAKLAGIQTEFGTYATLGNHEMYGGGIKAYVEEMSRYGIPVLMDETTIVADGVYLAGRKDKSDRSRASVAELLAGLDGDKPLIVMDHQPSAILELAEAGVDLSLHGHTHRGQMAPNHFITRRIFPLDWGYKRFGKLHAIVSSGFGTWGPPFRIGSRSELISVKVRFDYQS